MPYVHSNVMGHLVMLEAARALPRLRHLVYASSSSVYGLGETFPLDEAGEVDRPTSVYAATKRADELISHAYAHLYALPQTGLRFFTVYGPWGRPDMAYYGFAQAIAAGQPITLYEGGRLKRDFTYIDDIVAGVVGVLDRPPPPGPPRILNIGNNRAEPVTRLVALLEQSLGRTAIVREVPRPAADVGGDVGLGRPHRRTRRLCAHHAAGCRDPALRGVVPPVSRRVGDGGLPGHGRMRLHRVAPGGCPGGRRTWRAGAGRPVDRHGGEPAAGCGPAAGLGGGCGLPCGPRWMASMGASIWRRSPPCRDRRMTCLAPTGPTSAGRSRCWTRLPGRVGQVPFVYASSAAVYGDCPVSPIGEDAPKQPQSAYGADKYAGELHAAVATATRGIPSTGLRFFNVYGPRQRPDSPYSGVVSIFADRIARGLGVTVFGDGGQTRDLVHVSDVVAALLQAMQRRLPGAPVFNVCTGQAISVVDLAAAIGALHRVTPAIAKGPPRVGEIRHSVGDPARARAALRLGEPVPLAAGLRRLLLPS